MKFDKVTGSDPMVMRTEIKRGQTRLKRSVIRRLATTTVSLGALIMLAPATWGQTQPQPQRDPAQVEAQRQAEAQARAQAEAETRQAQAIAQQIFAPKATPIIKGISVVGNQRIEPETVASYLTLQPGMKAEEELLDLQVKTLYQTGLFANVKTSIQQDGSLLVEVKENPIVNRIIFEGNKKLKEEKFTEEIQLTARSVYTRAKVQADQQRMIEVYRATGRFAASITPKVVPLAQNRVDVIFEIDEGPKTGIAKVNFIGNDVFTSAELRKVILTSESRWWNLFGGSTSNYDPDRLEFERELLRQHYAKNGYADFKVTSLVSELTPDRKEWFVTFNIEEGPKYEVGEVKVRSALDKLDENVIERIVPVRTGQVFNGDRVESAVESLTFITGSSGYAFVDVNPRFTRYPESKKIDVTFEINEGPKVYVERINILGNTATLDKVIRRELRVVEGDPFNKVQINRSESVIRSLGYFSDVTITEKPGSAPDRTELDVKVTEQSTGSFSVGVGISSNDNFIADVSIEQRNFLGRGQALRFQVQASQRSSRVDLRFTQPRFLGRNLSAGGSIFYSRLDNSLRTRNGDRGLGGFTQESIGFGLNAGFQISEFGQAGINYLFSRSEVDFGTDPQIPLAFNIEDPNNPDNQILVGAMFNELGQPVGLDGEPIDLFNLIPNGITAFEIGNQLDFLGNEVLDSNGVPVPAVFFDRCDPNQPNVPFVCESEGQFTTSLLSATLAFSTLNDPFNPRNGWRARGTLGFAGLGGNVQYVRGEFDTAYYHPLPVFDQFVGVLKLRGGYIQGFAGDTVRIQDRFRIGGASFRGFEISGVGPRVIVPADGSVLAPFADPDTGEVVFPGAVQLNNVTNVVGGGGFQTGNGFFRSQSIGGNAYLVGTAEILLPLPLPESYGIRASLFTDFGTVGLVDDESKFLNDNPAFFVNVFGTDLDNDGIVDATIIDPTTGEVNPNAGQNFFDGFVAPVQDDLSFRLTAGVTISWNSPFGPVRFDIAEVFANEFFDEIERFRFSAGASF